MLKTIFINTLKLLIAAGLIYWLLSSGKLDFKLLLQLKNYPLQIVISLVLMVVNLWLVSYRWRLILKARSEAAIPLMGVFKVNWIGLFFSSVLPGSVSGDLVKMLYVEKFDNNFTKKFVFASILIDRVMGLCGLILLVGISTILFSGHILNKSPAMAPILNFNYLLCSFVLVGFCIFVFFHIHVRKIFEHFQPIFFRNFWARLILLWNDLVMIKSHMIKAVLISLIVQLNSVVIFWIVIYPFVTGQMDFVQALAFIPIGNMALALPIAPSGLGVGHAIFQKLFELSGIMNGASLFNLYFVVNAVVNIVGVIPYLTTKHEK
ncbi:MAG: lysylphosphatidylglycerol synthase transmembrane domain-containing protein [Bacteriovoracaceae bacterium]